MDAMLAEAEVCRRRHMDVRMRIERELAPLLDGVKNAAQTKFDCESGTFTKTLDFAAVAPDVARSCGVDVKAVMPHILNIVGDGKSTIRRNGGRIVLRLNGTKVVCTATTDDAPAEPDTPPAEPAPAGEAEPAPKRRRKTPRDGAA